ncbi:MAG: ergothioneine biosynthesis protein EgtB [Myxococcus sp.]|nr:ergothioneine biosynthesis protein EgtB [Myxococcus sp.]
MTVRQRLLERLRAARQRTDALFEWLRPEALLERPIAERHRLLFYVGHLEAFDWNLISRDTLGRAPRNAHFEQLFAFGIDPVDGRLPTDAPEDWPPLAEVRAWAKQARADVDLSLEHGPMNGWLAEGWAAHLAIEHRLMHAETLAYLFQRLPLDRLHPGPAPEHLTGPAVEPRLVTVPAGVATLGLPRARAPHLGWDNEYDEHRVEVPAFRVDRFPVSNGDFLAFVEAGGYQQRALWSDEAWAWLQREQVTHPRGWTKRADGWWARAMFAEVPLPMSWPASVSHAAASAYTTWKGARLMTEAEWHRAAVGTPEGGERSLPWGGHPPAPGVHGAFGFSSVDPRPVGSTPEGRSAFGVDELVGNGWEWTSTPFAPFKGFEPLPFYKGYSADFFDGQHFVMKGASAFTDVSFVRRSFRNWFQPHYPHVFSKFRCVFEGKGP